MKSLTPIAIFIGGVIVGFIICYMIHSTRETLTELSEAEAQTYFNRYKQTLAPGQDSIVAIFIENEHLHAMNQINSSRDNSVTELNSTTEGQNGFRIYKGKDPQNIDCSLIVCVTAGRDDCSKIIKAPKVFSPCPTNCDLSSHITR